MSDLLPRAIPWVLALVAAAIYHLASGFGLDEEGRKILLRTAIAALIGVICCQVGSGIGEGMREGIRERSLPKKK